MPHRPSTSRITAPEPGRINLQTPDALYTQDYTPRQRTDRNLKRTEESNRGEDNEKFPRKYRTEKGKKEIGRGQRASREEERRKYLGCGGGGDRGVGVGVVRASVTQERESERRWWWRYDAMWSVDGEKWSREGSEREGRGVRVIRTFDRGCSGKASFCFVL